MTDIHPDSVTFLFTDIQGSTHLWETHPEAMKVALARHDEIVRDAIESRGGHVFKTVGDAFCAAFANAPDALSAALFAQRELRALTQITSADGPIIRVRMGLHTGAVDMRNNDYFGPPLNRVARLTSAGHGGQILLSASTRELVMQNLSPGAELRDMGERSLKDLVRPEHIYQLTVPDLPADFPPLKTLEAFRTNLPVQITSFIGREKEIGAVKRLMAEHRLVTLTGSGGTGKTRLSLQVAADSLDTFPDGVWFVEFAPLSDPALLPQTVLTTLGLREEAGRPTLETLTRSLQHKNMLLILDNCEHLIAASAQLTGALLYACPNLHMLVSSREALCITGEKTYHVSSLSTPKTHALPSVESASQYEAINLFVDRAKIASSAFALTSANVAAVSQICARLDGIPLAIELAAARVKLLKVEQIAERLDDRFHLLTGGSRTALPRQQTLRAMIDWSYDLLPEAERVLLRRLSVFAGGWTLEAAEQVCSAKDEIRTMKDEGKSREELLHPSDFVLHPFEVLDSLTQLVNKSLVVVDSDDEAAETRYGMLETVRQYAREKLSDTDETKMLRDAHLQYFLGLSRRAKTDMVGLHMMEWVKCFENDFDNIRAAFDWSIKDAPLLGLRLATSLVWFWEESNYTLDGANWLEQFLILPEAQSDKLLRAKALEVQGRLLIFGNTSRPKANIVLAESLDLFQQAQDKKGIASSLLYFGVVTFHKGDIMEGKRMVFESLELHRELNDKFSMIKALTYLGELVDCNDYTRTLGYFNEALALCREIEYLSGTARILYSMGWQATLHGDYDLAHTWLEESRTLSKQLRKDVLIVFSVLNLGHLAFQEGKHAEAQAYYEEYLVISKQTKESNSFGGTTGWVTAKLGYIALLQSNYAQTRELFQKSLGLFDEYGAKIGHVYILEGLAHLAVLQKNYECAAKILAWADLTRISIDNLRSPVEQINVDQDRAIILSHIDEAAYTSAQVAGCCLSMDDAVTLAFEATHD